MNIQEEVEVVGEAEQMFNPEAEAMLNTMVEPSKMNPEVEVEIANPVVEVEMDP